MTHKFTVLGAGMQGTAAAFDIATFDPHSSILLADFNLDQARQSANRVNALVDRAACAGIFADALNDESLDSLFSQTDVLLSCVPYWMHPKIARAAILNKTHMLDLGGNTEITLQTLELDTQAREAEITLIPDNGLAPGLVNSLGMYLIEKFDLTRSVQLYCGVLPQNPLPPFNYKLTFNVEGLVTEYDFEAVVLRDGKIQNIPTLTEVETLNISPFGEMEAFVTSGGTSTAPFSLQGRVANYQYKTIRFPGHCERMKLYKDFGLWREDEIEVRGVRVRPKDVFCRVFGEELGKIKDMDMCLIRAIGEGDIDGTPSRIQLDIHDHESEITGFTSMERLTGSSIAIHALEVAAGRMSFGALRYETALSGQRFVQEIRRRGIEIRES